MVSGIFCIILSLCTLYQSLCYYGVLPLSYLSASVGLLPDTLSMVALKWGVLFGVLGLVIGSTTIVFKYQEINVKGNFGVVMLVFMGILLTLTFL